MVEKQSLRPFEVLHEDNHLLIVNKRAGILVQEDDSQDKPLADYCKDYIKQKYNKPGAVFLEPVHRIDRPVSGIVIFARTSKGLERMHELFRKKDIVKRYLAIVENRPEIPEGKLVHWLIKDREKRKSFVYDKEVKKSQKAELDYKIVMEVKGKYLLEITLYTGRPHQIRAQLASIGCPIQGDIKYGAPEPNSDRNVSLHNWNVSFIHPVKKEEIDIKAPLFDIPEWRLFFTFAQNN